MGTTKETVMMMKILLYAGRTKERGRTDGWYQQLVRGYGTTVKRGVDSRK